MVPGVKSRMPDTMEPLTHNKNLITKKGTINFNNYNLISKKWKKIK